MQPSNNESFRKHGYIIVVEIPYLPYSDKSTSCNKVQNNVSPTSVTNRSYLVTDSTASISYACQCANCANELRMQAQPIRVEE